MGPTYRFAFTPGEEAVLELIPQKTSPPPAAGVGAAAETNAPPSLPEGLDLGPLGDMGAGMQGMMGGMMTGMMQKMLQGMRVSMVLSVDGKVLETNAKYPAASYPNTFVLMDLPFDAILSHPDAAGMMMQPAPDLSALAAMDIPGLKMEEPGKAIRIRFK
jgi:hypothetical protein